MTDRRSLSLFLAAFLFCSLPALAQKQKTKQTSEAQQAPETKRTIYDFCLVDQDGKVVSLSGYKGKVLLIVNLASQSMYSDQIAALNDLQKTYGERGLAVIGIPSSDFGDEELKDPAAMRKYYSDTAHAGFPIYAIAKLTGINAIPLYQFLCDPKLSVPGGDIKWNFTKFLIDRTGKPQARYEVDVDPADADFHVAIESALSGKFKKTSPDEKRPSGGNEDGPENNN